VEGISGVETIPVSISLNANGTMPPDMVLSLVKCHDAAAAAQAMGPIAGPRTVVVSLQNGIGNEQVLADVLGAERIVAGVTSIGATLLAPGHVLHTSWGDTALAAKDPAALPSAQMVASFFSRHGIKTTVADNLDSLLWGRVLIKIGIGAITALTRVRNGKVLEIDAAKSLSTDAVREAAVIVKAAGIKLPYHSPVTQVHRLLEHTADNMSTMQQDIYKGRRSEIEAINGAIVRLAETMDRDAPINRTLLRLVQTLEAVK